MRVHRPTSPADTARLLAELTGSKESVEMIAGGSNVVPELTRGERHPNHLLDLCRAGLGQIEMNGPSITLGALVTYQQFLDHSEARRAVPLIAQLCDGITGGIQLRSQGTLGGSACAARPHSDLPSALVALEARMRIRSVAGIREVSAAEFLLDAEQAVLTGFELLESIVIDRPDPSHSAVHRKLKFAEGSWPIMTASATRGAHATGATCLVLGGLARTPWRFDLPGPVLDVEQCATHVRDSVAAAPESHLWRDIYAGPEYRRRVGPVLAARALAELARTEVSHDDIGSTPSNTTGGAS